MQNIKNIKQYVIFKTPTQQIKISNHVLFTHSPWPHKYQIEEQAIQLILRKLYFGVHGSCSIHGFRPVMSPKQGIEDMLVCDLITEAGRWNVP